MTPAILLRDAQIARAAGKLTDASTLLESAVGMDRTFVDGWENLAEVQESLGKWHRAVDCWVHAADTSIDAPRRQRNLDRLQKATDQVSITKLKQGEEAAQNRDFDKALAILLDAVAAKPSARTLDRVQSRYYDVLGAWFRAEVMSRAKASNWKSLGIATFAGTSESEGISVRDRIYASLTDEEKLKIQLFAISPEAAKAFQQVRHDRIPEADQRRIAGSGVDAIVFGTVDGKLRAYTHDVRTRDTRLLLELTPISRVPGLPSSISTWCRLPAKASTNRTLRVEVWTEKSEYTIGDEVVFYLRATQDCYVTLIDLQTSGGLYVLFPNSFQAENVVRGGRIYSVPAGKAAFTINAGGPTGVEGVKAIATRKRLSLPTLEKDEAFVALRTPNAQMQFSKALADSLGAMAEEDWDIAEWVFYIRKK